MYRWVPGSVQIWIVPNPTRSHISHSLDQSASSVVSYQYLQSCTSIFKAVTCFLWTHSFTHPPVSLSCEFWIDLRQFCIWVPLLLSCSHQSGRRQWNIPWYKSSVIWGWQQCLLILSHRSDLGVFFFFLKWSKGCWESKLCFVFFFFPCVKSDALTTITISVRTLASDLAVLWNDLQHTCTDCPWHNLSYTTFNEH